MKFDTFIFDLDGTLVEFNLNFDEIRRALGINGKYILESLMRLDKEIKEEKIQKLREFEIEAAKKAVPLPHAKNILIKLGKNGYSRGIVTRNCRDSVEIILKRFGITLDFVVTREDSEPKPSPIAVKKAVKLAGSSAERSIVIGDYKFDLMAGKNAGAKTVLLITERNREIAEDFIHLADYVIEGLDELEKFI